MQTIDDKVLILYIDTQNMIIEDAHESFQTLQKIFPNKTCICLPTNYSLEEVEKDEAIKRLQKMIDYLSQE